jgi:large subunit ribosomal protein L6
LAANCFARSGDRLTLKEDDIMSRIGKQPVTIPDKVNVSVDGSNVTVKGPLGELSETLPEHVETSVEGSEVHVTRADDSRHARAAHGLARTLVANMVTGVDTGFSRKVLIEGVGYRAEMKGDRWILFTLGYSHPILYELADGLSAAIDAKENSVTITGARKQLVGATAAEIRSLRPPEPYKGKGVRYADEVIRRKEGKSAGK